ncbi:hypothetical protein Tco_1487438, partial [Tanacetum coccineum]
EMAPSGSNVLLFDVHYDGIFMFAPLRYENGVVYELRVTKEKKYDYDGLCEFLKEKLEQRLCMKGCRRVIALDGCFLKKPNVGEILTAIGRDRNNHIFLVAWVVVNVENKDSGVEFRNLLWAASKATYPGLFNKIMDKIKRANPNAYQ